MGCPLYMYFVINVQEQGRRYEAIASVTVGTISDFLTVFLTKDFSEKSSPQFEEISHF